MTRITINGTTVDADPADTILKAAKKADIYLPTLCYHPDLPPRKGGKPVDAVYQGELRYENHPEHGSNGGLESGCGLCVVEMEDSGELIPGCLTQVADGMRILTDSERVKARS